MSREEYNLPLTAEAYEHLKPKADGILITKDRYVIPEKNGLFIELDVFHGEYEGVLLAEVEFPTEEAANAYTAPDWFGEDVTYSTRYSSSVEHQLPKLRRRVRFPLSAFIAKEGTQSGVSFFINFKEDFCL